MAKLYHVDLRGLYKKSILKYTSTIMSFTDSDPTTKATGLDPADPEVLSVEDAYSAYYQELLVHVKRFRVTDPEATVMDVFETALKEYAKKGDDLALSKGWYFRVAHNHAINSLRKASNRNEDVADPDSLHFTSQFDPTSSLVFQSVEFQESWQRVEHVLGDGPKRRVRYVARHALDGMRYKEIAAENNTAPGTIASNLFRAYSLLRQDEHLRAAFEGREVA